MEPLIRKKCSSFQLFPTRNSIESPKNSPSAVHWSAHNSLEMQITHTSALYCSQRKSNAYTGCSFHINTRKWLSSRTQQNDSPTFTPISSKKIFQKQFIYTHLKLSLTACQLNYCEWQIECKNVINRKAYITCTIKFRL